MKVPDFTRSLTACVNRGDQEMSFFISEPEGKFLQCFVERLSGCGCDKVNKKFDHRIHSVIFTHEIDLDGMKIVISNSGTSGVWEWSVSRLTAIAILRYFHAGRVKYLKGRYGESARLPKEPEFFKELDAVQSSEK